MFKTLISAAKAMLGVVAFTLAFTMNATAQDRGANGAQKMTDNMKTELSLTDAQYAKVLEINKNFADKTAEARKATIDKKQGGASIKELNEEREAKFKTVLTKEQYKTYLIKKEEKKKNALKRFSESGPKETGNRKPVQNTKLDNGGDALKEGSTTKQ